MEPRRRAAGPGPVACARLGLSAWLLLCAYACTKSGGDRDAVASVPPEAPAPSASHIGQDPAPHGASSRWRGSYRSTASAIYIPSDWKVRWSNADAAAGIGEGTLEVTVDTKSHRITGSIEGPLGPATIVGVDADGKWTANVARKDPADRGFSGTLIASVERESTTSTVKGSLSVSSGEASAVRSATFLLSPESD